MADSYDWFKGLVKERRSLDDQELAQVSDGRVFTAHQGLPLKLVDSIGGEREAIAWLEKNKQIAKDLPVRDWKKKSNMERFGLVEGSAAIARLIGMGSFADAMEDALRRKRAAVLTGFWRFGRVFPSIFVKQHIS